MGAAAMTKYSVRRLTLLSDCRAMTIAEYGVVIGLGVIGIVTAVHYGVRPWQMQVHYAHMLTTASLFGH